MTPLFGRTWHIKTFTAFALLVVLLILAFIFRRPLTVKGIEHFAANHEVTIQCLDFSLAWPLKVKVHEACVRSTLGELAIKDMTWQLWSNELVIEELRINHLSTTSSEYSSTTEQHPPVLDLPESLPKLNITNLQLRSDILLHPINLKIKSTSDTQVQITGDVNATVQVSPSTITTNIEWQLSDLTRFIPQVQEWLEGKPKLLEDANLEQALISTWLTYDGEYLNTEHTLDIASTINFDTCPIDGVLIGKVIADIELADFSVDIDLNQLTNQVSLENCTLIQAYLAVGDSPQLSLLIPNPFILRGNEIKVPKLSIIDLQNTNEEGITRVLELDNLNYKTAGTIDVGYKFSLEQPFINLAISGNQLSSDMIDFHGAGELFVDLSGLSSQSPEQSIPFKITSDKQQINIKNLQIEPLTIAELSSEFSLKQSSTTPLQIEGTVNTSKLSSDSINIGQTISNFVVTGESYNHLQLSLDNQIAQLKHTDFNLQHINNYLDVSITNLDSMSVTGHSNLESLAVQNIYLQPINIKHSAQGNLQSESLSSQHYVNLEQDFVLEITQQQAKINILISDQTVTSLENIIAQVDQALEVKQGEFSADIDLTLPQDSEEFLATGQAHFQNLWVKYQDYLVNNVSYQTPLTFNSAGLQLPSTKIHIDSIDVGLTITDITANVITKNTVLELQKVKGSIFSGEFLLPNLWLDGREQQFNINLSNIDLAEVMALQQQPGINITGKVNGDLPMIVNQQGIMVDDGWLSSLAGGKLTIVNNPSFDSIKAQQPELALLENLDFTQLDSKVRFNPDGWVFFDIALKGNNPDKNQSVNFNYSHEENLYSLLESIRLVNAVGDTIEQKINQGDKK